MDGHDQPACIEAARHARRAGMKVSIDVDKTQPGVAVITRGSRGSAISWEGEIFEVPGFEVTPVDTTDAGDVCPAELFWEALRFATISGAQGPMARLERFSVVPHGECW